MPIFMTKIHYLTVGGWDEHYPTNGVVADWDFFLKCELAGYEMFTDYHTPFYHFAQIATGEVDTEYVNEVIKIIYEINKEDTNKSPETREPIKLIINSIGGLIYDGFGLVDVIELSETPIHTYSHGCVMSMALSIGVVGHYRYASKRTTFMYHESSWGIELEKLKWHIQEVEEGKKMMKMYDEIITSNTNIPLKKLMSIRKTVNKNPTKEGVKIQFILPETLQGDAKATVTQKLQSKLTQGLAQYNLTIENAMRYTKSVRAAAKYLGCSYQHLKPYMKMFKVDENDPNSPTLFDVHLNRHGKGIPKFLPNKRKEPNVKLIFEQGSLPFTKMVLFASQEQLTNKDIDEYMHLSPQRLEGESDHFHDKWKDLYPNIPKNPTNPFAPDPMSPHPPIQPDFWSIPWATKQEFEQLKKEVEDMKKLLIRAKEYDEKTGQPDCEMEEKVALLKKVAELVGVDLSEIFGKK
ncbi:unnamed protein product [Wuchereria bancrofti]|uniref:ATP-dependent Clp protease proteolytic subunit n=1 Tax=Wuchereria bancrofti TaxID=6293 RepID=A0A3P7DN85_WUCBA|nr:unnamed protein product [Wuchereria bancrofti]